MRLLTLPILLLLAFSATAQIGGKSAYRFLSLPASARVAALGGTTLALKDNDPALAYHNPALLNKDMDKMLSANTTIYFSGINFGYAGYAKDFDSLGMFSAGIQYITYGIFPETDPTGQRTGSFYAGEQAFHLGWSRAYENYSFGAILKLVTSFFADYFSTGALLDVGGAYDDPEKRFTASLVFKNIGRQIKAYVPGNPEPMPFDIHLGISKRLEHLPFRFFINAHHLHSFDIRYDDPAIQEEQPLFATDSLEAPKEKKYTFDKAFRHFVFGGEFYLGKSLMLRAGYNHLRRRELMTSGRKGSAGFSLGAAIKVKKFTIEYARAMYHLAGASNHFSVSANASELFGAKKTAE